jgi:hypothetical protein
MDQDVSLCDVQNEINIQYKALVGPTHLLRHQVDFVCDIFIDKMVVDEMAVDIVYIY